MSIIFSSATAQDTTYTRIIAAGAAGDIIFLDENYEEFASVHTSNTKIYSIVDHYPDNVLHMVKVAPPPNTNQNFTPFYSLEPFTGFYNGIVNFGNMRITSSVLNDDGEVLGIIHNGGYVYMARFPLFTEEEGEAVTLLGSVEPGDHGLWWLDGIYWYFKDDMGHVVQILYDYEVFYTSQFSGLLGMNVGGGYYDGYKIIFASSNKIYEFEGNYNNSQPILLATLSTPITTLERIRMLNPAPEHVCVGDSVQISSRFSSHSFGWLKDGEPIEGELNDNLWVKETGTYNLVCQIGGNGTHFVVSEPVTITLVEQPVVTIQEPVTDTICHNGKVQIFSSHSSGNQWFLNGEMIDGATGNWIYASEPGVYNSMVTNYGGCSDSAQVGVTIHQHEALMELSLVASQNEACVGDTILIVATGNDSYIWEFNGNVIDFEGDSIYITGDGYYSIEAIDENGCHYYGSTGMILFYSYPEITLTATQDFICPNDSVLISAQGASNYEWYFNGENLELTSSDIYALQPGNYNVIGYNHLCGDSAIEPIYITEGTVEQCITKVSGVLAKDEFSIFPNPAKNSFTIKTRNGMQLDKALLYSSQGKLIKTYQLDGSKSNTFAVPIGISPGIYYVQLRSNDKIGLTRIAIIP